MDSSASLNLDSLPQAYDPTRENAQQITTNITTNTKVPYTMVGSSPVGPDIEMMRSNISIQGFGSRENHRGQAFKRAYRACVHCRKKKVKCDLGDINNPMTPPCARCKRENKECILADSRRGGITNVKAGREKRKRLNSEGLVKSETNGSPNGSASSSVSETPSSSSRSIGLGLPQNFSNTELHNTSDALDILAHAARSFPRLSRSQTAVGQVAQEQRASVEPSDTESTSRKPEALLRLEDTDMVKNMGISVTQIKLLVDFFFKHLHPFYPYIPREIQSLEQLADMPFLLTAILTLAARYYREGSDATSETAYYEIHEKCWQLCQRQFANTVWAEASTRSIGTVFVFMLFSEWNPRAIHLRNSDYANRVASDKPPGGDPAALGAFRRSDRMSWMLIGNAIRLAQDMGLMETNSKVYVATHLSEITLAQRLGRRSMLGDFLREPINSKLMFTPLEEAKLEIVRLMALAQDTLYASRETTRELVKDGKYLSFLGFFTPHLDFWERKYEGLFKAKTSGLDRESLLSDYHYARLYIYSLALSEDDTRGSLLSNIPAARYVGMATDAARELIFSAQRVHKTKVTTLRMSPIRWIVRVVHAAVFLLKSVLLVPASAFDSYHQFLVDIVRDLSRTLIEASPDEVHLCGRYGKVLLAMCSQIANTDETSAAVPDQETRQYQGQRNPNISMTNHETATNRTALPNAEIGLAQHKQFVNASNNVNATTADNSNLLSLMDMNFDFFMEGTEGLGFVEPFMEDIEQQEWFQKDT